MKRALLAGWIVLLAGQFSLASTIDAGTWTILPVAGQTVTVVVYTTASDPQPETMVGLTFFCSLVNGPDNSLKFTAVDFDVQDATYGDYMFNGVLFPATSFNWSGSSTAVVSDAAASGTPPGFGPAPYPIPGTAAVPAGLARVTLDASSATPGSTWDFLLQSTGGDTTFLNTVYQGDTYGNSAPPTLLAGTITIAPEPAVLLQLLALAGMGGVGFIVRRRKHGVG